MTDSDADTPPGGRTLQDELTYARTAVARLEQYNEALTRQATAVGGELAATRHALEQAHTHRGQLEAQLHAVGDELASARVVIAGHGEQSAALISQLTAVGGELAGVRAELAELKEHSAALTNQLTAVGEELAEARALLAASQQAGQRVDTDVLAGSPTSVDVRVSRWTSVGVALAQQDRNEEAAAALTIATDLSPRTLAPWRYLGESLGRLGHLDAAVAAHDRWFSGWVSTTEAADLRQRIAGGIARGVPPIVLMAMPKSASEFIMKVLARAYDVPLVYPSIGTIPRDRAIRSAFEMVSAGGVVVRQHMDGAPINRQVMREAGIRRYVVHLRDPRQATISWSHMIAKLDDEQFVYSRRFYSPAPPEDFRSWTTERQLEWAWNHYLPGQIDWLRSWLEDGDAESDDRLITTYDTFRNDPLKLVADVATFFDAPPPAIPFADAVSSDAYRNLRRGEIDEWRRLTSSDQQEWAWAQFPREIRERFNWRP